MFHYHLDKRVLHVSGKSEDAHTRSQWSISLKKGMPQAKSVDSVHFLSCYIFKDGLQTGDRNTQTILLIIKLAPD